MTHIDVYDEMNEVRVCVAYNIDGKETTEFPSTAYDLDRAKPVLKHFKGWKTVLSSVKEYDSLPGQAKEYIKFIEDYTGTPVGIVSVGYERKETMMRIPLWKK